MIFPKGSILYVFFLIFSLISVFVAYHKQIALETTIIYFSGFLVLIIAYNQQEVLSSRYKQFVLFASVVYSFTFISTLFFPVELVGKGTSLMRYFGHSQIGNLFLTPFFLFPSGVIGIISLFFIIISYSRATYLAVLAIAWVIYKNKFTKKGFLIKAVLAVLTVSLILSTTFKVISENGSLLGLRDKYFADAVSGVIDRPFFGAGPGNYRYISASKQVGYSEGAGSSHNLILDIFSQNGILAGLFFILFLTYVLKKGKRNVFFYSFLALSVVFLFDHTFEYNSFLFLWFFLAGLSLDTKDSIEFNPLVFFGVFLLLQLVFIGKIFHVTGNYTQALFFYPLQEKSHYYAITNEIKRGNMSQARDYLNIYEKLYGENFEATYRMAKYYERIREWKKSLKLYRKSLELRPFLSVTDGIILEKIHNLSRKTLGYFKGDKETEIFFGRIKAKAQKMSSYNEVIGIHIDEYCNATNLLCYNVEH